MEIQLDLFLPYDEKELTLQTLSRMNVQITNVRRGVFHRVDMVHKELNAYKNLVDELMMKVESLEARLK